MFKIIERVYMHAKGMKYLFFVPFIVYYLLLPFTIYAYKQNPIGNVEVITIASEFCYNFVPVISTWWIYMYFIESAEGEGREILILGKGITATVFAFYLLNAVSFIPICLVLNNREGAGITLMLQLLVITFLMYGVAYFLSFLLKSIAVSVFIVLCYSVFAVSYADILEILQYGRMLGNVDWIGNTIILSVLGSICWYLGHLRSKYIT